MRFDHLGLISGLASRGVCALLALTPPIGIHSGPYFSASAPPFVARASAASFDKAVTPTPTVLRRGQNVRLTWAAVSISSGRSVQYRVLRGGDPSGPVAVCQDADAPVTSGLTVTCMDRKPGNAPTYTVQAYVADSAGNTTWSLPAGPAVSPS